MKTDLNKYHKNLYDITKRMEVVSEHLRGISNTKYIITEVEFLCLQFRKILELIALTSLVANKEEYSKQHVKFAKHYNARLILQDLERINLNFYPKPSKQIVKIINGKNVFDQKPITHGFLNKEDFLKVYEKCGSMLHAENPYSQKHDLNKIKSEFSEWFNKIRVLLNIHVIELADGETMIMGIMQAEDGFPKVLTFTKKVDAEADEILRKASE